MINVFAYSRTWRQALPGSHGVSHRREIALRLGTGLGRILPVGLVLVAIAAGPAQANDTTIPCSSPPSRGAYVAVHPGAAVSETQDDQDKTCTFAINGAVATSPPPNEVLNALNEFRNRSLHFLQDPRIGISAVAALMAASAPVDEVPSDLLRALKSSDRQLNACLATFFDKRDLPNEQTSEDSFSCRGFQPYSEHRSKLEALREFGFAPGVATLVISVKWQHGRYTSTLYLPSILQELPPIPLQ